MRKLSVNLIDEARGAYELAGAEIDLKDTFECGQCFRWNFVDGAWQGVACGKVVRMAQSKDGIIIENTTEYDIKNIWIPYLDLKHDYEPARRACEGNEFLTAAAEHGKGIRILRQPPEETLFSFIISANNNIKRITGIVDRLCILAGEKHEGTTEYYSFPAPEAIAELTVEQLTAIGSGYRAPYIKGSARMIADGYELETLRNVPTAAARIELLRFPGVGPKVADCVLLFSLGHADAFPLDVWMKRAMRLMYFQGAEPGKKAMEDQIAALGPNSGILQQYIFQYARENM